MDRLAELSLSGHLKVYAWALMSNHFHLLVRTGNQLLASSMRRLLTGYVVNFNRRHKRYGHLFQNLYKAIFCEDDPYLLELTRYIHLNPLRAGVVESLDRLNRYQWSGHAVLMGKVERILGSSEFVEKIITEAEQKEQETLRLSSKISDLDSLARMVSIREGIDEKELRSGSKKRELVRARRLFCQLAVRKMGYSGAEVARFLGVTTSAVNRSAASQELPGLDRYI